MISPRLAASARRALGGLGMALGMGLAVLLGSQPAAFAQGRLDARYEATLAGIPIGKGA
jgi:hypothetical protein